MGRPNQFRSKDAFTPSGSGRAVPELHDHSVVPTHIAKYHGRPPYETDHATRERLRKKGAA
ncbi:MAG: hypothetical protein ACYDBQ_03520 [Thermoplasmatota archaeon]